MTDTSFPKRCRLLKRRDFQGVVSKGQHFAGNVLLFQWRPTTLSTTRLGIIVTKKFGNAVQRNRFKRLVREAFRLCRGRFPASFDLTIRPRKSTIIIPFSSIVADFDAFIHMTKENSVLRPK